MQIFRLLFRAVVLVIARWQAGSTLITFRRLSCLHLKYFFSALDKHENNISSQVFIYPHGLDPKFCGPAQRTDGLSSDSVFRWL